MNAYRCRRVSNAEKLSYAIHYFTSRALLLLQSRASTIVSFLASATSLLVFSSTVQESPLVEVLSKTARHQVPKFCSCERCSEAASAETAVAMAAGASPVDLPG